MPVLNEADALFLNGNAVDGAYLNGQRVWSRVPWPISPIGLTGWWDASDLSSIELDDVGNVTDWRDKSGLGRHVSMAVVDRWPQTGLTINELNVLSFDGLNDYLIELGPVQVIHPVTGEWSAVCVVRPTTTTGTQRTIFGQQFSCGIRFNAAAIQALAYNDKNVNIIDAMPAAVVADIPMIASAVRTTETIEAFGNGLSNGTTAALNPSTTGYQQFTIGLLGTGYFEGDIAEIIIYSRALDTVEREAVEDYLRTKWAVPPAADFIADIRPEFGTD